MDDRFPVIAVSSGDPAGIGPEIALKACQERSLNDLCRIILIGSSDVLEKSSELTSSELPALFSGDTKVNSIMNVETEYRSGTGRGSAAGAAAGAYIKKAVELCLNGTADAMTTCPIDKSSLQAGGFDFPGHTEMIAHLTGTEIFRMAFVSPRMKIVLNTTHLPLSEAIADVTFERVLESIVITDNDYKRFFGCRPRIGVCGLNPHAGEGGILGSEENNAIGPAINAAVERGINAKGPFAPDTFFVRLVKGDFDIALAMYHDQGLIALKTLDFISSVNTTLGLPIIRTSVDHGVAYDLAGKNTADPSSLIAAVRLAASFAKGN